MNIVKMNLSKMSEAEKEEYYLNVCKELGLNPKLKPFAFLKTKNGTMMYALRSATDQLRSINNLSSKIVKKEIIANRVYEITGQVSDGKRCEESIGAVSIVDAQDQPLKSNDLVNAIMQAGTKAIRRATLSFCGISFLDESERDTFENEDQGVPEGIENATLPTEEPNSEETEEKQDQEFIETLEFHDCDVINGKRPYYELTFRNEEGVFTKVAAIDEEMDLVDNLGLRRGLNVTIKKVAKNNNYILRNIKLVS
ncbi:hypothetical protein AB3N04_00980 (plasmid) [Alkalihalophilus sp. As8PL]|uniref:Uncharacterized protein n=1 Tax=Alkalihalophilus sp. As8PL TaxID=3237103 RepID=A0AB39BN16_9BACI